MSRVTSFRLSSENPREAKALEVREVWQARAYSVRQTIAKALVKLDKGTAESIRGHQLNEINEGLNRSQQLVEELHGSKRTTPQVQDSRASMSGLTDDVIA